MVKVGKRLSIVFGLLIGCLGATSASATTLFTIVGGSLTASRSISGSGETDDVRGNVTLDVNNGVDLGNITIEDITGGTDPTFLTLAFGNSTLFGTDGTQTTQLVFDFTQNVVGPSSVAMFAVNSALSPNPTTDAALLNSLGGLEFDFTLVSLTGTGPFLAQYSLSGVSEAPEPGSLVLVGFSLVLIGVIGLRRRFENARPSGK